MGKYFVISGFAAAIILASLVARAGAGEGSTSTGGGTSSSGKVPTFTLDQAILTALQRNPTLLIAEQEIKRTKGVIIQVRAQALPNISARGNFDWTDPNLIGARIFGNTTGTTTTPGTGGGAASFVESVPSQGREVQAPLAAPSPTPSISSNQASDVSYSISVVGTQLIFNGTTYPQIRGTFFQRDSAYFGFRNVLDQLLATVKTQFYQVILNRELIKVQEESVHLLESQLKDQQNRFEAGTVPRFNVLQAEVALYNQLPLLITAQNNYRISKITLAKTLGLDFQPRHGESPPLEVIGEMPYNPRKISLVDAIELGKERRPFLKQARANVLNQKEQLHAAAGQWLPTITTTGGGEWVSSPTNSSWHDISKGWIATVQGSLPIWDSGAIAGQVLQQRALLSEAKDSYDDDVRQVELEVQTAYSNLLQNRELIKSQVKNVEEAEEAVRLAKARLDAGAGVQLDVLNAQVQLLTAQSTQLQALFGYNSTLAEFDRATGAQSTYHEMFSDLAPHATRSKTYNTSSDVDAEGKPKHSDDNALQIPAGRSRTSYSK
ncbi:MAG TPA: TolC family protein [Chthoniobacterales bacterium]|jgi:outer membrane protein TolC|nr:TolC family protein [Chthoniobacterales bacterium]